MNITANNRPGDDPDPSQPLVRMVDISKSYPGVLALQAVSFDLLPGEVHCLVGENGAGKSTLMKILAGAEQPSSGEIYLRQQRVKLSDPATAKRAGIGVIYQDFKLVPYLSVAENIALGHLPRKKTLPLVDWRTLRAEASQLLETLGEHPDLFGIEIAKILHHQARIIAMDEPSATLTDRELANLFRIIGALKERKVGIIYISHRLEEISEIGDRLTILRDGRRVHTGPLAGLTRAAIVRPDLFGIGREINEEYPQVQHTRGETILEVENLSRSTAVRAVSFGVCRGEIFGLAGLVGSGRTELARLLFGADRKDSGRIVLAGKTVDPDQSGRATPSPCPE